MMGRLSILMRMEMSFMILSKLISKRMSLIKHYTNTRLSIHTAKKLKENKRKIRNLSSIWK
jgi:hypothetical protein